MMEPNFISDRDAVIYSVLFIGAWLISVFRLDCFLAAPKSRSKPACAFSAEDGDRRLILIDPDGRTQSMPRERKSRSR